LAIARFGAIGPIFYGRLIGGDPARLFIGYLIASVVMFGRKWTVPRSASVVALVVAAGPARLTVVIHRAGARLTLTGEWSVAPPAAPRSPSGSLPPIANGLAIAVLEGVLAIGVWWVITARRRRRAGARGDARGAPDARTEPVDRKVLERTP
jgi:hypothetical protein